MGASGVSCLGSVAWAAVVAASPWPLLLWLPLGGAGSPAATWSPVLHGHGLCQKERTRSLYRDDADGQIGILERHYCVFRQDSEGMTHCRLV